MLTWGILKTAAKKENDDKGTLMRGALIGAGAGAAINLHADYKANKRELQVSNTKSYAQLKKKLKPGDIIIAGSTARHSGGVTVESLPKPIQKIYKRMGLGKSHKILSNSSLLNTVGAGSKYHGGIYAGKGRIIHMTTDEGAVSERLEQALSGQNFSAWRPSGKGSSAEMKSAVNFAKKSVKNKVPYESALEYMKEPLVNLTVPNVARKACRDTSKGMVCHTLPVMAYNKRKFSQGRRTYSGDIRRNQSFKPVARRDVIKLPASVKMRGMIGQIGRGAAYALPGAGIAYGIKKIKEKMDKKD